MALACYQSAGWDPRRKRRLRRLGGPEPRRQLGRWWGIEVGRLGIRTGELGREDSNLQLPKSRGKRAPHRTKRDKKLSDASDAEQTHAERKTDPETVTKPSSASAP